jgi:hypothetical protein
MRALRIFCLRSLRITTEPQSDQKYVDGIYATFASRDETATIEQWLKYTELELQYSRMVCRITAFDKMIPRRVLVLAVRKSL